jgi:anti-sigma-K factor RskA
VTNPNEIENLTGAYVLDAATADERAAVEAEGDRSQAVRNELTELADTAVLLGLAVDPVEPSPELKTSLMAMLDSTPQLAPEPRSERSDARVTALPAASSGTGGVTSASFDRPAAARARARWFTRPVAVLTAVAAAAALVVGGVVVTDQLTNQSDQQAQIDELTAITAASDSRRLTSNVEGGGTATVVWSHSLASAAIMVDGIAALPADKAYQLWYIDEAGARPAGTFTVGASGSTWRVLDGEMGAGDTIGVTIEPAGGSDAPTTDPVVAIVSA